MSACARSQRRRQPRRLLPPRRRPRSRRCRRRSLLDRASARRRAGIACPFRGDAVVALAFGASSREAVARLDAALQQDFDALVTGRRRHDSGRLSSALRPAVSAPDVGALYRRSLLALDLLTDRDSGAVIAAPELDPHFESSGGYGFVWGRDLAFIVLAFLAAGRSDLASTCVALAPSRAGAGRAVAPAPLDRTARWRRRGASTSSTRPARSLFAYEAAWRPSATRRWTATSGRPRGVQPSSCSGRSRTDGIPCTTADLWEEREGRHAFTAAAIYGGLRAAASMARRHEAAPRRCIRRSRGSHSHAGIERELWSDFHGRYLRSLGDPVADVSLLGLAWPFAAVDPAGERMRATVAALEAELRCPSGGVMRYAGDTYAGGNRWVLAALWLGLWHRQVGDDPGLARALEHALEVQTDARTATRAGDRDGDAGVGRSARLESRDAACWHRARSSSSCASSRRPKRRFAHRSNAVACRVSVLAVPQPYDFELSLDRFTFWGVDRANVCARRRPASGRRRARGPDHPRRRRRAASSRSTRRSEPVVLEAPRARLRPRAVPRLCAGRARPGRAPCAGSPATARRSRRIRSRRSSPRSRRSRSRCMQRSLFAAASSSASACPAVHAVAFPTRERVARATEDELTALGFSRRKAEYVLGLSRVRTSTSTSSRRCPTRRSRRASRRCAGSANGAPTGSSPATSPGRRRGRPATSACARRCSRSTLT